MELIVKCANKKQADNVEHDLKYWDHMDSRGVRIRWTRDKNLFHIQNYIGDPKEDFNKKGMKVTKKDWIEVK